ncbi:regulator of chromosome condensation RCC1 [Toxoplasma gondii TgCatPRC2]|uniref:Regulator of chromosome condensation RCC1 n=1 Tax=Toxoplasma gondii TgCatPRC2 TaxID=1130821 RepID=A0A151HHM3_TOXGO|nr:regulator of chromosome condensation RCC1 [Toxoplasma gondii TgCatPRC2]
MVSADALFCERKVPRFSREKRPSFLFQAFKKHPLLRRLYTPAAGDDHDLAAASSSRSDRLVLCKEERTREFLSEAALFPALRLSDSRSSQVFLGFSPVLMFNSFPQSCSLALAFSRSSVGLVAGSSLCPPFVWVFPRCFAALPLPTSCRNDDADNGRKRIRRATRALRASRNWRRRPCMSARPGRRARSSECIYTRVWGLKSRSAAAG